jgi:hypothetical protein
MCSSFEDSPERTAEINALGDDSELAKVLGAWPMLSVEARAKIIRLVEATKGG